MAIPGCFSELKFEKCGNLCGCTHSQGNCKILKMIDFVVARNSTSIVPQVEFVHYMLLMQLGKHALQISCQHFNSILKQPHKRMEQIEYSFAACINVYSLLVFL